MLSIIAYEVGVSSKSIQSVIDALNTNNKSMDNAQQQLVNGLYRSVEMMYLIANKSDTFGLRSSYISSVYSNWSKINDSCTTSFQQAANGLYRFVELLAAWAHTM